MSCPSMPGPSPSNPKPADMIQGLEGIRRQASPRPPLRGQKDQGKELYNAAVQARFKKHGWHHFSTYGGRKASMVERWHRTLKQRMYRYFTAHNTLRYVDVLQPLIHTYNQSCHRSIGMAPHQVAEKTVPKVWDKPYGHRLDQKTTPPQMSSGRSRTPQQETSSLQKRLFTGMDGRSVVCLVNVPDRTGSRILAKDPHTTVIQFNMTFLTRKYITGEHRWVSFKTK